MPIYTTALNPKDFGFADLLNNSLQLIIPILTLCISEGVFRFTLDKDSNPVSLLTNGLRVLIYGILGVSIIGGIVYAFNPQIYWLIFVGLYISESIRTLLAQFTRGLGKVREYAVSGILSALSLLISTFILLKFLHYGITGYLLSYLIANVISISYLLILGKAYKYISFSYDKTLTKALIIYSLPLVPNMLSWWLTNISSRYIIALYYGLSLSGLFAAASKLPALINVITSVFQLSWQFASVKEYQESQSREFYKVVFKYYSFLVVVAGSFIITFVPIISKFLLKDDFYTAWTYTPLLLFAAILGCYATFLGTFYSVVKQSKGIMQTTIIGSIVNLIICFAFLPFFGIKAALWANVLSYVTIVILRVKDCKNLIELQLNWNETIIALLIIILQCVVMTYLPYKGVALTIIFPFGLLVFYGIKGITIWGMIKSLYSAR